MAPVLGRGPDGKATTLFDNVGVQYGLQALEKGQITAAQLVHVNTYAGGFDVDGNWQRDRSAISSRPGS